MEVKTKTRAVRSGQSLLPARSTPLQSVLGLCVGLLLTLGAGCSKNTNTAESPKPGPSSIKSEPAVTPPDSGLQSSETNAPEHALTLPVGFHQWTGDLDGMVKRKV